MHEKHTGHLPVIGLEDVSWAQIQPHNLEPPAGAPAAGQEQHVTSSGARGWNETLTHWGMSPQVPSDVRANTLPGHSPPSGSQRHVTSSGSRTWEEQRKHWGMRE